MAVSDISQKLIKLNKMQIYQCYICKTPLIKKSEATSEQIASKKYESEEHIIPNSLGGYLTSYKLLCADCNSKLGQSIDNILLEQIPIAKLGKYPKNRDSDYEHKIKTKTKDGEEFYIKQGFTPVMVKPEIETWYDENGKLCLRIKVPTLKIAKQMLNGLKKRHPEIDVNELENKIEWRDEYINEMIYFEAYMGGNDFQRALSKIAINYYLHEGGDIDKIKSMISYLKDEINLGVNVNEYYSFVGDFHEINDDEVSHLLFLKGDSKKRLLYCYIELFSCYNFMVILSDNYADKDFEKTYCYDILKKKELSLNKNVKLTLLRHPFRGMGRYNRREYHDEYLTKKIERLYQLFGIVSISSTKPINN